MSKKHVDEYFNKIVADYKEMLDTLKDMEEECSNGLIHPDKIEQMKQIIIPLRDNYMTLSWIMFLLNKPAKKQKQKKYEHMLENKMNDIDPDKTRTPNAIHNENKDIIDQLKNSLY